MRSFFLTALVLAVALAVAAPAHAGVWAEVGDAGALPGSAQIVSVIDPLTAITGSIGGSGDADMYRFSITSAAIFSATTVGTPGTLSDTQLFLFDVTGMGIAVNDDSAGEGTRSRLPVGNALYSSLTPGDYLLVITSFNNDPVSPGGLIFPNTFPGVFGPTGPGGGSPISGYTGSGGTGTYTIELTGAASAGIAAIPEPTTLALLASGILGLGAMGWRRVRKS